MTLILMMIRLMIWPMLSRLRSLRLWLRVLPLWISLPLRLRLVPVLPLRLRLVPVLPLRLRLQLRLRLNCKCNRSLSI